MSTPPGPVEPAQAQAPAPASAGPTAHPNNNIGSSSGGVAFILPAVHSKRVRVLTADGTEEEADDNPWLRMQLKDPFQQVLVCVPHASVLCTVTGAVERGGQAIGGSVWAVNRG